MNIQDINYGIQEKVKLEIESGIIINNLEKPLIFGGSQLIADFGIHRTLIIEDLELQPMIVQLADFIVHRVLLIDANSICWLIQLRNWDLEFHKHVEQNRYSIWLWT